MRAPGADVLEEVVVIDRNENRVEVARSVYQNLQRSRWALGQRQFPSWLIVLLT